MSSTIELSNDSESDAGKDSKVTMSDKLHARVWVTKYRWIWITLIMLIVFGVAFVVGYSVGMVIHMSADPEPVIPQDYSAQVSQAVSASLVASQIESELKWLAQSVHIAGTSENEALASRIAETWRSASLQVRVFNYTNVALQYPLADKPNAVTILDDKGASVFATKNAFAYFNAYSATGSFRGKPLYVNYGRAEDFATLSPPLVSCPTDGERYVAIARYGSAHAIVRHAEAWCRASESAQSPIGALVLFGDPAQFAKNASEVYPNGVYLRGEDVIVGTLRSGSGDPLTHGLPSIDGVFREPESNYTQMIVQPVSYDDAAVLLKGLAGSFPGADWKGDLPVDYTTGPGYIGTEKERTVQVTVGSDASKNKRQVQNVATVFRGTAEPDRYVIVGAHYDSMTFGASDPGGASAILTRLGIALGERVKNGWKPRRSILLVHWDGEQFNKIGSQEFVDQFGPEIQRRTVAYINVDDAVEGQYSFHARGHPLLSDVVYNASKSFTFPGDSEQRSVYSLWSARMPLNTLKQPAVEPIGAYGDQWSFWNLYGVPYLYPHFNAAPGRGIPFRYTRLDTYEMVSKFVDPNFVFHELLGRILADSVLRVSDSAVIPYSFVSLSESLSDRFNKTIGGSSGSLVDAEARGLVGRVQTAIREFTLASYSFVETVNNAQGGEARDDAALRELNEKIMLVPQVFLTTYNADYRRIPSLLYGVDHIDRYSVVYFPGVQNALSDLATTEGRERGTTNVKRELSALVVAFQQATAVLGSKLLVD